MQVNRIGVQPDFQAKFIRNDDLLELTKEEIKSGKQDALCTALENLGNTRKNVRLALEKDGSSIEVTNLFNGNKTRWADNFENSKEIMQLSDPFSKSYYELFLKGKEITASKAERSAQNIAAQYYTNYVPDYGIGHIVDKTF